ncbi:hypothetical protein TeGR_g9492 [Tetraparma gracilis]|uniref:Uncharacterized protein n=1 Tax=Tetraparma gracilis TaxID=2962635 RepID=A0ABQ6N6M2_9STRA|nr:hypothetical protein TeGR_g9492 [Tetraparma gracilis]
MVNGSYAIPSHQDIQGIFQVPVTAKPNTLTVLGGGGGDLAAEGGDQAASDDDDDDDDYNDAFSSTPVAPPLAPDDAVTRLEHDQNLWVIASSDKPRQPPSEGEKRAEESRTEAAQTRTRNKSEGNMAHCA